MPTLGQRDFSAGWIPSDDAINSRRNGLLRMDNLHLDDRGIISLTKGTSKVNNTQFSSAVFNIFSRVINNQKHRYVNDGTTVKKDINEAGTFGTTVLTGGSTNTAFGAALGQVFIFSGTQKKKDDGTTIRNFSPVPTGAPTVVPRAPTNKDVTGTLLSWTELEGNGDLGVSGTHISVTTDATTFRAKGQVVQNIDTTDLGGSGNDRLDDPFIMHVRVADSAKIEAFQVEFILETPPADSSPINDYYICTFPNAETERIKGVVPQKYTQGVNKWTALKARRGDFERRGDTGTLDWADVKAIRVTAIGSDQILVLWGGLRFFKIGLTGEYEYLQVNVYNSGSYNGKSPVSAKVKVNLNDQHVDVTPNNGASGFGTDFNEFWIYRRKVGTEGFFRVAIRTATGQFTDSKEDDEIFRDGILVQDTLISLPNFILDVEALYFRRAIYMTSSKLCISSIDDPESCDSKHEIDVSSDEVEKNLWVAKVSDSTLLLGTTKEIYELSGTLLELPDGTIDAVLRPLGINQPPISRAHSVNDNSVIYMASDGWRIVRGNTTSRIVGSTRLLYENEDRYGIDHVLIKGTGQVNYDCVYSKGKLFTTVTLKNGLTRRCYIYSFPDPVDNKPGYWYPYFINPVSLFTEEDGTVLAGFGDAGDFNLREINTGTLLDGTTKQQINLRTGYFDADLPNNRKDLGALTIYATSGGDSVNVAIATDGSDSFVSLGNFTFTGNQIRQIKLRDMAAHLGKNFALQITDVGGAGVADFELFYWTIDYEVRPEQRTYLFVPPQNLGVAGRKRFSSFPIAINTLGNNVTVTPILDGIAQTSIPVTTVTDQKRIVPLMFTSEVTGGELGLEIEADDAEGGFFEFYELIPPRDMEVIPDQQKFRIVPPTDFGIASRKRFYDLPFRLNTLGNTVTATPILDGVEITAESIDTITDTRKVITIPFTLERIGFEIGLKLSSGSPFEFHGYIQPKDMEIIPDQMKFFRIPTSNFGTSGKKRIRTLPIIINTFGNNVTYTPTVDGINGTASTLNANGKLTKFHFFEEDSFGIDYGGTLDGGGNVFEFYGFGDIKSVEELPAPTKWDQMGPLILKRSAFTRRFCITVLPEGISILYRVYAEDNLKANGTISVEANKEKTYEIDLFKGVSGNVFRVELESTNPFHRLNGEFWVKTRGEDTEFRRLQV